MIYYKVDMLLKGESLSYQDFNCMIKFEEYLKTCNHWKNYVLAFDGDKEELHLCLSHDFNYNALDLKKIVKTEYEKLKANGIKDITLSGEKSKLISTPSLDDLGYFENIKFIYNVYKENYSLGIEEIDSHAKQYHKSFGKLNELRKFILFLTSLFFAVLCLSNSTLEGKILIKVAKFFELIRDFVSTFRKD